MKISKLFHWLYAILMLLPVLVFIPNAFYYGFNEYAVAQEKTEQVPVYYESNEVSTYSDLVVGNIYYWSDNYTSEGPNNEHSLFYVSYCSIIPSTATNIRFYVISSGSIYINYYIDGTGYSNVMNSNPCYIVLSSIASQSGFTQGIIDRIQYTDYKLIKDYQPLTTNMSITDSMSYAWDSVWQNDLFSWTYDSFLTQPFLYITNLFNVPPTNTLLYCLSYWLNISIIWLTFDLVMYVPLLVHRWIDKGIVE